MHETHTVELARIKYRVLNLLPLSSLVSVCTLLWYLAARIFHMTQLYGTDVDSLDIINSVLYFVTELGIFLPGFLNHLLRCLAFVGRNKAPHLRLLGNNDLPKVDIFVTCAGEDFETVQNTIAAACAIDYPEQCFRVVVLDDAGSKHLSEAVRKMSESVHNLYYTARTKGKDHHFKAGNLNHGLDFTNKLSDGPAEYIAALDADMIPDPQFLRALLPHLLRNPNVALAQLPQRFYDVPSHDPLLQGLDVNFKVTEPLKEAMGSTWCGGSGYVLHRAALDSIGGFPTESVGEDMYCSNVLLGKGWDALYVDEALQTGRVPESYKAHVKQQTRWHVGRYQTAKAMRFYLYGQQSQKMNLRQRAVGLIYVMLSLLNILTTAGMATLLLSLASGRPLVVYESDKGFFSLIKLISTAIFTEWLDDFIAGLISGHRVAISEGHINFWIAPYHAVGLIQAFAPQWLQRAKFEFTASGSSEKEDKNKPNMQPKGYLGRVSSSLRSSNVGFHSIYVSLLGLALGRQALHIILQHAHSQLKSSVFKDMVTHFLWPPLVWLVLLNSFAIPLFCAFHPLSIPNRSQLLKVDPVRRASYPQAVTESGQNETLEARMVIYTGTVIYTVALGILAAFYA